MCVCIWPELVGLHNIIRGGVGDEEMEGGGRALGEKLRTAKKETKRDENTDKNS